MVLVDETEADDVDCLGENIGAGVKGGGTTADVVGINKLTKESFLIACC